MVCRLQWAHMVELVDKDLCVHTRVGGAGVQAASSIYPEGAKSQLPCTGCSAPSGNLDQVRLFVFAAGGQ